MPLRMAHRSTDTSAPSSPAFGGRPHRSARVPYAAAHNSLTRTPGRWHIGSGLDCVQIGAPVELARFPFGVQRLADRVDSLVETGRSEVGAEGVDGAQGKRGLRQRAMNRRTVPLGIGGPAPVLLEGDAAEGEATPNVVDEDGALFCQFSKHVLTLAWPVSASKNPATGQDAVHELALRLSSMVASTVVHWLLTLCPPLPSSKVTFGQ